MDTGFVLDLFKRTTDAGEARAAGKQREKAGAGPLNSKRILPDVGDLHSEEEYQGLDLAHFMESLGDGF
jgi:hypothetical protein